MINNFLAWLGLWTQPVYVDGVALVSFWHTPLGLFCSFTLAATSTWRTLHRESRADLFDVIWHFFMALTCTAAFVTGLEGDTPQHVLKSLIVLMTVRGVYKCFILWRVGRATSRR